MVLNGLRIEEKIESRKIRAAPLLRQPRAAKDEKLKKQNRRGTFKSRPLGRRSKLVGIQPQGASQLLGPLGQVRVLGFGVRVEAVLLRKRLPTELAAEVEALNVDVDDVVAEVRLRLEDLLAEVAALAHVGVLGGLPSGGFRQVPDDDGQRVVGVDGSLVVAVLVGVVAVDQPSVSEPHVGDEALLVGENLDALFAFPA